MFGWLAFGLEFTSEWVSLSTYETALGRVLKFVNFLFFFILKFFNIGQVNLIHVFKVQVHIGRNKIDAFSGIFNLKFLLKFLWKVTDNLNCDIKSWIFLLINLWEK